MQTDPKIQDGRADFDFLMCDWRGQHRRLRERLTGCTLWEEFDGTLTAHPILGGLGNVDEVIFNRESGSVRGGAVRLFDIPTRLWRIYWMDGTHGALDVPMVGAFVGGRGEFYAHEVFEGKAIFSRFIWILDSPNGCRWEQAFSPDGGRTWETNWTMIYSSLDKGGTTRQINGALIKD